MSSIALLEVTLEDAFLVVLPVDQASVERYNVDVFYHANAKEPLTPYESRAGIDQTRHRPAKETDMREATDAT